MQNDTRNLAVARDHLTSALDSLRRARAQNDRAVLEGAARRALDDLHLAWRRLEEERARSERKDTKEQAEVAFGAAQTAWQHAQDLIAGRQVPEGLEGIGREIMTALSAIETACDGAESGDPIHAA